MLRLGILPFCFFFVAFFCSAQLRASGGGVAVVGPSSVNSFDSLKGLISFTHKFICITCIYQHQATAFLQIIWEGYIEAGAPLVIRFCTRTARCLFASFFLFFALLCFAYRFCKACHLNFCCRHYRRRFVAGHRHNHYLFIPS